MMGVSLRARVVDRFGSVSNFAKSVGWSNRKASYVLKGKQPPNPNDIEDISKAIGVENSQDFAEIFFPELSRKWTSRSQ